MGYYQIRSPEIVFFCVPYPQWDLKLTKFITRDL